MTAETVSRWENGRNIITKNAERILRLHVVHSLRARAPGIQVDDGLILDLAIPPVRLVGRPTALIFELRRHPFGDEGIWEFRGREEKIEDWVDQHGVTIEDLGCPGCAANNRRNCWSPGCRSHRMAIYILTNQNYWRPLPNSP